MNASIIKIIALFAMLADHIGTIIFPENMVLKIIGRIAFPLFCYFIAEGYLKTHNVKKYILRLFILAVISQIPFTMAFKPLMGENFFVLTTIFDLFLGLVAITLYDKAKFKGKFIIILLFSVLAYFSRIDGDYNGILLIFIFYKFHDNFKKLSLSFVLIEIISLTTYIVQLLALGCPLYMMTNFLVWYDFVFSLLALIPIKFYNGEKGFNIKYLFYIFYPTHLLILHVIYLLIQ